MSNETFDTTTAEPNYKIGLVSFTDPRTEVEFIEKREQYIETCQTDLQRRLQENDYEVIAPQKTQKNGLFGINSIKQINDLVTSFTQERISALVIGCFAWNEPNTPLELAKKLDIPTCLVTRNNPLWPGITAIASTGASFWEVSSNYYIKYHSRFLLSRDGSIDKMLPWVKAACTVNHLRTGTLLLWGGSPALNMEHLNDDIPFLKRFLINDIQTEDQYLLVKGATKILQNSKARVTNFKNWLEENGCKINYDEKMVSIDILEKQIALYLAAKDQINNHFKQDERIIGTSIKCQPELSVDYGITPCLLPAFLPYSEDHEGKKPIIPSVCEGHIKGLITSAILFGMNKLVPPLFGDIKVITDNYFILANCGAASAYYGALNDVTKENLSRTHIKAQCQGAAGGAFGYHTPPSKGECTYARLCRIDGNYFLQFGIGKIIAMKEKQEIGWGVNWPHTAVELHVKPESFIKAIGTNHLSLTIGNFERELEELSRLLEIPTVRLDSEESIAEFLVRY